jgi:hypothetical protein
MDSHLLFKFQYFTWNDPDGGVTIDRHTEVIKKLGKVWWGRTTAISRDRADALGAQIRDGTLTYAFLYATAVPSEIHSDGNLWYRAKVVGITLGKPDSIEMIPEYYRDRDLELYCLLSEIEPLAFSAGSIPRVPGQTAVRHVAYTGSPIPANLVAFNDPAKKICVPRTEREEAVDDLPYSGVQERTQPAGDLSMRVIDLQDELLQLKDEVAQLRTYKDFYNKILNTDYLFSSEKFFETWIQENMHKMCPEIEIIDRQPVASWPDGKFGRLDLLAFNKETKGIVVIEVKTRKRSKKSGYDQFVRYTTWARRNIESLRKKYRDYDVNPTVEPSFLIITDYIDDEMQAICRDQGIALIHIFGGLGVDRAA